MKRLLLVLILVLLLTGCSHPLDITPEEFIDRFEKASAELDWNFTATEIDRPDRSQILYQVTDTCTILIQIYPDREIEAIACSASFGYWDSTDEYLDLLVETMAIRQSIYAVFHDRETYMKIHDAIDSEWDYAENTSCEFDGIKYTRVPNEDNCQTIVVTR